MYGSNDLGFCLLNILALPPGNHSEIFTDIFLYVSRSFSHVTREFISLQMANCLAWTVILHIHTQREG